MAADGIGPGGGPEAGPGTPKAPGGRAAQGAGARRRGPSRAGERTRALILDAALAAFAEQGFRGATLDAIAARARLSKPNLLYHYPSKEAIHLALLRGLLDAWLAPLRDLDPAGEPLEELARYVRRKLDHAREHPRESRLFANEVLRGAPHLRSVLEGELAALVEAKAAVLGRWMAEGRLAALPPEHLLMAVWALTQHYADFEAQVRAVLGPGRDPFAEAGPFLDALLRRALAPGPGPGA